MKVYSAQINNSRVGVQPTKHDFQKYLSEGYNIIEEDFDTGREKIVCRFGYPEDIETFEFPSMQSVTIPTGGNK